MLPLSYQYGFPLSSPHQRVFLVGKILKDAAGSFLGNEAAQRVGQRYEQGKKALMEGKPDEAAVQKTVDVIGKYMPLTAATIEYVSKFNFAMEIIIGALITGTGMWKVIAMIDALFAAGRLSLEAVGWLKNVFLVAWETGEKARAVMGWGLRKTFDFAVATPFRATVLPAAAFLGDTVAATGNFAVNTVRGLPEDIGNAVLAPVRLISGTVKGLLGGVLKGVGVFSQSAEARGTALLQSAGGDLGKALTYNVVQNAWASGSAIVGSAANSALYAGTAVPRGYARLVGAQGIDQGIANFTESATQGGGILSTITGTRDAMREHSFSRNMVAANDSYWDAPGIGDILRPQQPSSNNVVPFTPRPVAQQPQPPAQQQPDPYAQAA
jgi:hypothetical protein